MRHVLRNGLMALGLMVGSITSATAQVSIGIGLPGVSIGINLPVYPELVPVPGYPVYYAPRVGSNYFFYDGMYWVYQSDNWYVSSWYNGPWGLVVPEAVPLYVLRVPVRYYHSTPLVLSRVAGRRAAALGAITGAMNGSSVEAIGIIGIVTPHLRVRHCRRTSGNTPVIDIRLREQQPVLQGQTRKIPTA